MITYFDSTDSSRRTRAVTYSHGVMTVSKRQHPADMWEVPITVPEEIAVIVRDVLFAAAYDGYRVDDPR